MLLSILQRQITVINWTSKSTTAFSVRPSSLMHVPLPLPRFTTQIPLEACEGPRLPTLHL